MYEIILNMGQQFRRICGFKILLLSSGGHFVKKERNLFIGVFMKKH